MAKFRRYDIVKIVSSVCSKYLRVYNINPDAELKVTKVKDGGKSFSVVYCIKTLTNEGKSITLYIPEYYLATDVVAMRKKKIKKLVSK
jgi:hypothetical protein